MKTRSGATSLSLSASLSKIYYSPGGYWKGYSAFSKLADAAGVSENEAKEWLKKQALWQIYFPYPRYIPRPHLTVDKPNEIHQADLLFLPHDTVRRKTFKYALVVIDVASRYKDAEPLTSKESSEVAKSFEKIYSRKLKWPERIIIDPGKEFMGRVTSLMKRHNVIIQRSEAGNHRAQAFVERANRTLSERLFSFQYGKEMSANDNERSREWVFSHMNNLLPASFSSSFHFNFEYYDHFTRSRLNLHKVFAKYHLSICSQAPSIWNSLPLTFRNSLNISNYRSNIKKHFLNN